VVLKEREETMFFANWGRKYKWMFAVEKCAEKFVSLDNLLILAEFLLCLPGSNVSVERIFSLMNIYWYDEKNRASLSLLRQF
jgi:hypothetical protein